MPIPSGDLPGYGELRERFGAALDRCQEGQAIEFKESAEWEELKWKIMHTSMGMANLRDGGIIIIGVSERADTWQRTGIEDDHLATYDPDIMTAAIDAYASPSMELDIVEMSYEAVRYLVIGVREFRETPVVCKKTRDGTSLRNAALYVRPPGVPRTTQVTDSRQMHELLELAAEKRARRIIATAERVGLGVVDTDKDRYEGELGGL